MEKVFEGKVWKLGDDIDTDIIIPTQWVTLDTMEELKTHIFEPLRPELAASIRPGDIIVAGNNFGCGSSREQAPEGLSALKISCIIAKSFARIFFRNAINNVRICPTIVKKATPCALKSTTASIVTARNTLFPPCRTTSLRSSKTAAWSSICRSSII